MAMHIIHKKWNFHIKVFWLTCDEISLFCLMELTLMEAAMDNAKVVFHIQ